MCFVLCVFVNFNISIVVICYLFVFFVILFSISFFFFFFSSRRRHTRSKRDWSSDVCSSDLLKCAQGFEPGADKPGVGTPLPACTLNRRQRAPVGAFCRVRAPGRFPPFALLDRKSVV